MTRHEIKACIILWHEINAGIILLRHEIKPGIILWDDMRLTRVLFYYPRLTRV